MTPPERQAPPSPNACRYCDVDRETHLQRWADEVGWHQWVEPTSEQRKARMLQRAERPDLSAWRRRHELRRSSSAAPIPSGKQYQRKPKHQQEQDKRDE